MGADAAPAFTKQWPRRYACYNRLFAAMAPGGEGRTGAMIVGIVVALFGVGAIVLGAIQLAGRVPVVRRAGTFSAYMNVVVGIFLIALGALRIKGVL